MENYATIDFVIEKIQEVVSAAPDALATLERIANELESDETSVASIMNSITELRERVNALEPTIEKYYISDYYGFCKLTLSDDSVVELEGEGALIPSMMNNYESTVVTAELGTLCTAINDNVFLNCTNLSSVIFSNSVKSIGINAFKGCTNLVSLGLSNSVNTIGNNAF